MVHAMLCTLEELQADPPSVYHYIMLDATNVLVACHRFAHEPQRQRWLNRTAAGVLAQQDAIGHHADALAAFGFNVKASDTARAALVAAAKINPLLHPDSIS
jgi:hypothetical protein